MTTPIQLEEEMMVSVDESAARKSAATDLGALLENRPASNARMTMNELKALAWKPIDTAPKDGSIILLTAIEDDGELFEVWPMQWAHIQKNGLFPGRVGMWTHPSGEMTWNGDADIGGPTHWHPVPEDSRSQAGAADPQGQVPGDNQNV